MVVDIKKLIAAINPDVFCDDEKDESGTPLNKLVKEIAKKEGYRKAADKAKIKETDMINTQDEAEKLNTFKMVGLKYPIEKHTLSYDASSQSLEQVYFWILDTVNREFGEAEKLVDNFVASPGSGHFAEMSKRATVLHDDAMKLFGTINTVVRSVLNLIYDLKEFKLRLSTYDDLKSKDKKNAALLSLKQLWMDRVDINRGTGSINGLAQQLDFVTIRDAFMASGSLEEVNKLDLNDRVKRILQQRVPEFFKWVEESEKELRKRFEIEKIYLKSQVNSLKLYSRWLKPILKSSQGLEQNLSPNASIVNQFNTAIFELVLMAKGKYDPKGDVDKGLLPKFFLKTKMRKYTPISIVEFSFRSIPERVDQRGGYMFRGKIDITFSSFALNEDELQILKSEIEKDDIGDAFKYIMGATEESLAQINADIDDLLEGSKPKKEQEKTSEDINPFRALFNFSEKKTEKKDLSKGILKDTDYEKVLRSQAILSARYGCGKLYNGFKKSYGWPTI